MRSPHIVSVCMLGTLALFSGCGITTESTHTRSAFGRNDIQLVKSEADLPSHVRERFGVLVAEMPPASPQDQPSFWPVCGALIIDQRHIVTNAHCVEQPQLKMHFLRGYLATGDSQLEVRGIADQDIDLLRLALNGEVARPLSPGSEDISLSKVAGVNKELDIAVLVSEKDTGSSQLIAPNSPNEAAATLFHFPNGQPLALSANCIYTHSNEELFGRHDCDSLPGSSAGILVSQESGEILAIHRSGRVQNSYRHYLKDQRFETMQEMVGDKCTGAESQEKCLRERSFNKAIPIANVLEWQSGVRDPS